LTVSHAGDHHIATPLPRGAGTQMMVVRANAYLHVPPGTGCIREGTEVEVLLTGPRASIGASLERRRPAPEGHVQGVEAMLPLKNSP
ncbi:MAG: molybdopterin molybdenumtransferase MoeA, partial [Methanomicrobiales archaeon]|nr:molybdopterin molybdenumtransferase MoeA [Methanomicrobiales archaeon]